MPKKSKREKMMADIRRRVKTEHVLPAPVTPQPLSPTLSTFQFRMSGQPKTQEHVSTTEGLELTAIKKDLAKTMILAIVAVGIELALYWFGKGKI